MTLKEIGYIISSLLIGAILGQLIPRKPVIETVEKVVEVEKKVYITQKIDKNTVTTKKPDGTVIIEEDLKADVAESTQESVKTEENKVVVTNYKKYSLGIGTKIESFRELPKKIEISAGYNIIGPLDVEISTIIPYKNPLDYQFNLGIGVKWRF